MEHGTWSMEAATSCIQVVTLSKKKCIIRLHNRDLGGVSKLLDAGIDGIILSTVESSEEAQQFVDCALHHRQGGSRGLGLVRQNFWGEEGLQAPLPMLIPQIETIQGIRNLPGIVRDEFTYYLIGPYDLSASLGQDGDFEHPQFIDAIDTFNEAIPPEQRAIHLPTDVPAHLNNYASFGMICVGIDTVDLIRASKENLHAARGVFDINTDQEALAEGA
jgi:2-dehydro-3-deoxyglucarate aldolase